MWKNMQYVHLAEVCEKCGNKRIMRQSHIHIQLTCLITLPHVQSKLSVTEWYTPGR